MAALLSDQWRFRPGMTISFLKAQLCVCVCVCGVTLRLNIYRYSYACVSDQIDYLSKVVLCWSSIQIRCNSMLSITITITFEIWDD
jgi:hypothetical protein